jgi:hypothetical protein
MKSSKYPPVEEFFSKESKYGQKNTKQHKNYPEEM